jgi:asparagine synthase (glutamine-hydrolysing)
VLAGFSFDRMVARFDDIYLSNSSGVAPCPPVIPNWRSPDMCGIAGIVAVDGLEQDAASRALRMRDIITYRGPDEAGLHCDSHAALAHRRLSIVDLSRASSRWQTRTAASG